MVNAFSPTTYTDEANCKAYTVKDNESFYFKGELMLLITTIESDKTTSIYNVSTRVLSKK